MNRILSYWWLTLVLSVATILISADEVVDLKITKAMQDLLTLETAAAEGRALPRAPKDPWLHPYVYKQDKPGGAFRIYSSGVDGIDDDGGGDDVTTTEKAYRCEDYGTNCPHTLRDGALWVALYVALASLIVGLMRLGSYLRQHF